MDVPEQFRRYQSFDASKGFPANEALYYECLRCGELLSSSPPQSAQCRCGNITIDLDGLGIAAKDLSHLKLFSITSAGRVNRPRVMEALKELADHAYQSRVWLGHGINEQSSFVEAVCGLYDDSGLGHALDKKETVFTIEIDTLLRELNTATQKVDSNVDAASLIEDPSMQIVRKWAADILRRIQT